MAPQIPVGEPSALAAGTTWKWTQAWSDFPATDGWSVTYCATGAYAFTVTTAQNGSGVDFLATKSSTDSALVTPGTYTWEARATLSSETYVAGTGTWVVTAKPATTASDARVHAQTMLDLIEAELEARITGTGSAHESYTIGDQQISKLSIADLQKLRATYALEVQRLASLTGALPAYEVRFGRP